MADDIKCPFCSSKDLTRLPAVAGADTPPISIIYKCHVCHRTFSKTAPKENS